MPEPKLKASTASRGPIGSAHRRCPLWNSWLGHALGKARGVRFYYEPDNVDADPKRKTSLVAVVRPYR